MEVGLFSSVVRPCLLEDVESPACSNKADSAPSGWAETRVSSHCCRVAPTERQPLLRSHLVRLIYRLDPAICDFHLSQYSVRVFTVPLGPIGSFRMAEKVESPVRENVLASDVKCRASLSGLTSAPHVPTENPPSNQGGKEVGGDIEQLEKKRTRRRRKAKRKNPYNKQNTELRGKKALRLVRGKNGYEQPVAPYNSNQFLIEDHNDLKDFDVKLLAVAQANKTEGPAVDGPPRRTGRVRDPSFTSADSDDDYFYSSPEDEEEFLTKEFSNTYQDLHAEDLASMSKSELIQQVLQLEEKCDALEKRLSEEKKFKEVARSDSESNSSGIQDKMLVYQKEISKLTHVNEELKNENMKLKQQTNCGSGGSKCGTESSEDSESDSSSSSESSEMSEGEEAGGGESSNPYIHMNGHLDPQTPDPGRPMETDHLT